MTKFTSVALIPKSQSLIKGQTHPKLKLSMFVKLSWSKLSEKLKNDIIILVC